MRRASGKPLLRSGLRSVLQYLCKQGACIETQYRRGLTGTLEVRMVWWGFRALKRPEERHHCRRFSVGCLIHSDSHGLLDKHWTITGRILDKMVCKRVCT
jgi:hypothetical protein